MPPRNAQPHSSRPASRGLLRRRFGAFAVVARAARKRRRSPRRSRQSSPARRALCASERQPAPLPRVLAFPSSRRRRLVRAPAARPPSMRRAVPRVRQTMRGDRPARAAYMPRWPRRIRGEHRREPSDIDDLRRADCTELSYARPPGQRRPARQEMPPDAAACIEIARNGRGTAAGDALGRQIVISVGRQQRRVEPFDRPQNAAHAGAGKLNLSAADRNRRRRYVAMHDAGRLQFCQGGRHLPSDFEHRRAPQAARMQDEIAGRRGGTRRIGDPDSIARHAGVLGRGDPPAVERGHPLDESGEQSGVGIGRAAAPATSRSTERPEAVSRARCTSA